MGLIVYLHGSSAAALRARYRTAPAADAAEEGLVHGRGSAGRSLVYLPALPRPGARHHARFSAPDDRPVRPSAGDGSSCCRETQHGSRLQRGARLSRWLHEHRHGTGAVLPHLCVRRCVILDVSLCLPGLLSQFLADLAASSRRKSMSMGS